MLITSPCDRMGEILSTRLTMILFRCLLSALISMNLSITNEIQVMPVDPNIQGLSPKNQCLTKAFVIDASGRGLNIRQKPNSLGKIMGRLAKSTEVNVLGTKGEWLLISVINPIAQKVTFRSMGWVYSSLLGVSTKGLDRASVSLYSQPSFRSDITGKIPPNTNTNILSCSGKWLRVESKEYHYKGWLDPNQQCAAAYTSCS